VAQGASNEVAKPEQGRMACHPAYQKTDHYYPAAQPPWCLPVLFVLAATGIRSQKSTRPGMNLISHDRLPKQTSQKLEPA
jgi:hypothetical protein